MILILFICSFLCGYYFKNKQQQKHMKSIAFFIFLYTPFIFILYLQNYINGKTLKCNYISCKTFCFLQLLKKRSRLADNLTNRKT